MLLVSLFTSKSGWIKMRVTSRLGVWPTATRSLNKNQENVLELGGNDEQVISIKFRQKLVMWPLPMYSLLRVSPNILNES